MPRYSYSYSYGSLKLPGAATHTPLITRRQFPPEPLPALLCLPAPLCLPLVLTECRLWVRQRQPGVCWRLLCPIQLGARRSYKGAQEERPCCHHCRGTERPRGRVCRRLIPVRQGERLERLVGRSMGGCPGQDGTPCRMRARALLCAPWAWQLVPHHLQQAGPRIVIKEKLE